MTTEVSETVGPLRARYIDLLMKSILGIANRNVSDQDYKEKFEGLGRMGDNLSLAGWERLKNLRELVEIAIKSGIPGDFIETGVWKGGACILMRGVLAAYGITDRSVYVADSFKGVPAPDVAKYPGMQR